MSLRLYRVLVRFPGQRHRVALTVRGGDEWEAERSALSHLEAHRLPGGVVLSGYRSALYDELFEGWQRMERTAWADRGAERTECLWLSPRAQARGLFGEV